MTLIVNIIACKPRIYRLYGPSQVSNALHDVNKRRQGECSILSGNCHY